MFHLLSSIYTDLTTRRRFNVLFLGGPSSGKTTLLAVLKQNHVEATPAQQQQQQQGSGKRREAEELPKTRPTVGQNVLDVVAPSLPAGTDAAADEGAEGSSSASMRGLQQIWPRPVTTPQPQSPAPSSKGGWFTTSSSPSPTFSHPAIRTPSLIHIWDLGGDPSLRSLWREYYKEAHAVVYFWNVQAGREEQWETLKGVTEERELRGKPVLVVLSRGDRAGAGQAVVGQISRARRQEKAEEGEGATAPQDEDEHGDLSLSMDDPRRGPSDGDGDGRSPVLDDEGDETASKGGQAGSEGARTSSTAATLARAQTQDDVLESVKAFLESQIEAHVVEGIGNSSIRSDRSTRLKHPVKEGEGAGEAEEDGKEKETQEGEDNDDAEEEDEEGDAYTDDGEQDGPPLLFPPTTLLPLSLVEGYGEQDVMRWMIARSLEAAAEASR